METSKDANVGKKVGSWKMEDGRIMNEINMIMSKTLCRDVS